MLAFERQHQTDLAELIRSQDVWRQLEEWRSWNRGHGVNSSSARRLIDPAAKQMSAKLLGMLQRHIDLRGVAVTGRSFRTQTAMQLASVWAEETDWLASMPWPRCQLDSEDAVGLYATAAENILADVATACIRRHNNHAYEIATGLSAERLRQQVQEMHSRWLPCSKRIKHTEFYVAVGQLDGWDALEEAVADVKASGYMPDSYGEQLSATQETGSAQAELSSRSKELAAGIASIAVGHISQPELPCQQTLNPGSSAVNIHDQPNRELLTQEIASRLADITSDMSSKTSLWNPESAISIAEGIIDVLCTLEARETMAAAQALASNSVAPID